MEDINKFKGYLVNASKYSEIGEYEIALDMVNKMHEISPDNDFVYLISASIKFAAKDYLGCINDSKNSLRINPNNSKSLNMLGVALCTSGNIKAGLETLKKGVELNDIECKQNYEYWIRRI